MVKERSTLLLLDPQHYLGIDLTKVGQLGVASMSEIIYNLYEAKTSLSRLVERAARGEEIILAKAGKPLAKLVPFRQPQPRQPGGWEGRVRISEDFDAPLPPEIQAAFEGRE
jgi:prevent-host-death family protein